MFNRKVLIINLTIMDKRILCLSLIILAAVLPLGTGCITKKEITPATQPAATSPTAATGVTFDEKASDAKILADKNGQWAASAKASTQYGEEDWAAK